MATAFRSVFSRPNLLTLLALCSGVTAIRFGMEGRFELAVGGIIFAFVLDGFDGRLGATLSEGYVALRCGARLTG